MASRLKTNISTHTLPRRLSRKSIDIEFAASVLAVRCYGGQQAVSSLKFKDLTYMKNILFLLA